jgi:hypothetical protein
MEITSDDGYLIAGYTESFGAGSKDYYVIKTDSLGDEIWSATYGGVSDDGSYSAAQTADEGYIIAGNTFSFGSGAGDIWLLRLSPETEILNDDNLPRPSHISLSQNYPNPFNASTTIEFTLPEDTEVELAIYDLLGRKVTVLEKGQKSAGDYKIPFDASGLSSGVYFYRLQAGESTESKRMVRYEDNISNTFICSFIRDT